MRSVFVWTTCLVLGVALSGMAQPLDNNAGRKFPGYRPATANAYQRTAREHTRVLNYYGTTNKSVPAETVQEHVSEVKRNVAAAQTEFAKLGETAKKDPEVAKSLKIIQDHNAKAMELCKMAEADGGKNVADSAKLMECCNGMHKELVAAEAEHVKLMQHLKIEPLEVPAK